jgi:hypothetical protein
MAAIHPPNRPAAEPSARASGRSSTKAFSDSKRTSVRGSPPDHDNVLPTSDVDDGSLTGKRLRFNEYDRSFTFFNRAAESQPMPITHRASHAAETQAGAGRIALSKSRAVYPPRPVSG